MENIKQLVDEAELAFKGAQLELLNMKSSFLSVAKENLQLKQVITALLVSAKVCETQEEVDAWLEGAIKELNEEKEDVDSNS